MVLPRTLDATAAGGGAPELREIAGREQAPLPAGKRRLPVLPALQPLLPGDGLQRGSIVVVSGSTSLALALVAGASAAGSWCAAVGMPSLGLMAASELGIALDRFPLVASPSGGWPGQWGQVVSTLIDAFDIVVAAPPAAVPAFQARRLVARARQRGSVLVIAGGGERAWPQGAGVRLTVTATHWEGVGKGHGCLRGRRLEITAGGRGAAARPRRLGLWLPHPDGGVAPAPAPAPAPVFVPAPAPAAETGTA